ncbi:Hypothetical protein CINCED_3A023230 [Cinara cedri]|uniref:Mutator-like transposase domain-containing protein n=1 Tax=Cinara cedri TaxID=506608 RepID=A0A5E4MZ59_9HEMI|nr:Hypothetical protein CINCED_3A023230 [Cinara cedri]
MTVSGTGRTRLGVPRSSVELPVWSRPLLVCTTIVSDAGSAVQDAAAEGTIEARDEERGLATDSGDVDDRGVPACTVIADGRRPERHNLNVMLHRPPLLDTGQTKILFVGVRTIGTARYGGELIVLNWKKASTAMEADAIVEGFCNSVNELKYNKLIGK